MMTQGFYQNTASNGFREYLTSSMSDMFSLDLSRCTLTECITKMCEIKSRSHPKIKQNYRMLVNKLEDIEKQFGCTIMPTIEQVKAAVYADINRQTDEKILTGFVWNDMPVYLSDENQRNFSEAQRIAMFMPDSILPVTFKLGENAEGGPVYHEFTTPEELTGFFLQAVAFINQCLAEGWGRKDGIDWEPYLKALDKDSL